jgi:hypothetical protein
VRDVCSCLRPLRQGCWCGDTGRLGCQSCVSCTGDCQVWCHGFHSTADAPVLVLIVPWWVDAFVCPCVVIHRVAGDWQCLCIVSPSNACLMCGCGRACWFVCLVQIRWWHHLQAHVSYSMPASRITSMSARIFQFVAPLLQMPRDWCFAHPLSLVFQVTGWVFVFMRCA